MWGQVRTGAPELTLHAEQAELELSREQEARLLQARAHVLVQVGALAAERRRIGAALQVPLRPPFRV